VDGLARLLAEDPRYRHTTAVVVRRRGETVFEHGAVAELADTYSMTKSVVATLLGIALDRAEVASLDEPVRAFLGDRVRHPYTLRHLATMTAGSDPGGAWDIDEVMARPSGWVDRLLGAPRLHEPGTRFAYDNGAAHVLGAALAAAVARPLSDYAAEHLFTPLGIESWEWPRDPDGLDYGFGHLRLRPHDVARLGELYRGAGEYESRRVVSAAFVADATRAQTAGGPPEGAAYGLLWWVADDPVPHFFAGGYAGQSLTVIPELELVAVTTGSETLLRPGWRNARHAVLEAYLGHCPRSCTQPEREIAHGATSSG
jgi:CubicO group peptidase (beta-lactamase class C family)